MGHKSMSFRFSAAKHLVRRNERCDTLAFLIAPLLTCTLAACSSTAPGTPGPAHTPTSASAEEAGPPTSYGDTGPVYADAQGRAVLRVLSEGPEQITVKELANGRIHYFKQVPAASGVRYQAADGTFFWTKGRNAMLGRGEKTLRDDLTLRTR